MAYRGVCIEVSASKFLENFDVVPPDEADDLADAEDDAASARESKIQGLIYHAFKRMGIELAYEAFPIHYDDKTREALVKIEVESNGVSLSSLNELYKSGLSQEFFISPRCSGGIALEIGFMGAPELDNSTVK